MHDNDKSDDGDVAKNDVLMITKIAVPHIPANDSRLLLLATQTGRAHSGSGDTGGHWPGQP